MTVAISGGAGFLGLHLARHLCDVGEHVRTLDLVPLDSPELESAAEEMRGDVRDPNAVSRLVRGAEVVVTRPRHFRSRHPASRSSRSTSRARPTCLRLRSKPAYDGSSWSRRRPSTAFRIDTRSSRTIRSSGLAGTASRRLRPADLPGVRGSRARRRDRETEDLRRARKARRLRDSVRLAPRGSTHLHARFRRQPVPAPRSRGSRRRDRQGVQRTRRRRRGVRRRRDDYFGTVREDLQALVDHAGSSSRPAPPSRLG